MKHKFVIQKLWHQGKDRNQEVYPLVFPVLCFHNQNLKVKGGQTMTWTIDCNLDLGSDLELDNILD